MNWDPDTPTLCQQTISGRNTWTRPCGPHGSQIFWQRVLTSAVPCTGALPTSTELEEPRLGSDWYHIGGMAAPFQLETGSSDYCWNQAPHSLRLERPEDSATSRNMVWLASFFFFFKEIPLHSVQPSLKIAEPCVVAGKQIKRKYYFISFQISSIIS